MNDAAVSIDLVSLTSLDTEIQLQVLQIRNADAVRKWMYTDHIISEGEHLGWIDRLKNDRTQMVLVVLNASRSPMGIVSLNKMDRVHKKTDWAFYLRQDARGGLGSALEYSIINFVFDDLGLLKLNCEVIEGNDAVVNLHRKFGFLEEGFRRSDIVKNSSRLGVHLLGLTKQDWQAGKNDLFESHKSVFARFDISILMENATE